MSLKSYRVGSISYYLMLLRRKISFFIRRVKDRFPPKYKDTFPTDQLQTQEYTTEEYLNWINHVMWKLPHSAISRISDSYNTFGDLYAMRKMYQAALFNEWAKQDKYSVHKSTHDYQGQPCFTGYFLVAALLPTGTIFNHHKMEDWDLFQIPVEKKALWPYDGQTGKTVITRLKNYIL